MIINKVKGSAFIKRKDLENFQWKLKKLDNTEKIENLANRILKVGFKAPIFIWDWHKKILDGHQRSRALNLLAERWETLENDNIPVVYIIADTLEEAKESVLEYNSKYSEFDTMELHEWLID